MTEAAALEMFRCDRRNMTLSRVGCSRLWLSTQDPTKRPDPSEGRFTCMTCDIGCFHATGQQPASEGFAEVHEALRTICPRCLRRTDRMIAARAPGNPNLCISCTNRHYEAFRSRKDGSGVGRNGKGGRPLLCDLLHTVTLLVTDQDGARTRVVRAEAVTSASEAMFAMARKASGPMMFSRATRSVFEVAHYVPDSEAAPP
jgi:hypothetical protein